MALASQKIGDTGSKVSVVIPLYNHEDYVAAAIESVLGQTVPPLEIIVIDDGSTDAGGTVVEQLAAKAVISLRYLRQENGGSHAAINRGLELARGEWLAILNSDDVWVPTRLEEMLAAASMVGADFLFSRVEVIGPEGNRIAGENDIRDTQSLLNERRMTKGLKDAIAMGNLAISTSNFLFTRRAFEALGGLLPYRYNLDWEYLLRVSVNEGVKLHYVEKALLRYRWHSTNTIHSGMPVAALEALRIVARYMRKFPRGKPRSGMVLAMRRNVRFLRRYYQRRVDAAENAERIALADRDRHIEIIHARQAMIENERAIRAAGFSTITNLSSEQFGRIKALIDVIEKLSTRAEGEQIKAADTATENSERFLLRLGEIRAALDSLPDTVADRMDVAEIESSLRSQLGQQIEKFDEVSAGIAEQIQEASAELCNLLSSRIDCSPPGLDELAREVRSLAQVHHLTLQEMRIQHANEVALREQGVADAKASQEAVRSTLAIVESELTAARIEANSYLSTIVDLEKLIAQAQSDGQAQVAMMAEKELVVANLQDEVAKLGRERLEAVQMLDGLREEQAALMEMARIDMCKMRIEMAAGMDEPLQRRTLFGYLGLGQRPTKPVAEGGALRRSPIPGRVVDYDLNSAGLQTGVPVSTNVHVHMFYRELADEMFGYLENIPKIRRLVVTGPWTTADLAPHIDTLRAKCDEVVIESIPNRGKDVGGFLHAIRHHALLDSDVVLKIHSKKSHNPETYFQAISHVFGCTIHDGDEWRKMLIEPLSGSQARVFRILAAFARDPGLGMVGSGKFITTAPDVNQALYHAVCGRLDMPADLPFVAGTMFWARSAALRDLLRAGHDVLDFDLDSREVEGGLEHIYERVLGGLVQSRGFNLGGVHAAQ